MKFNYRPTNLFEKMERLSKKQKLNLMPVTIFTGWLGSGKSTSIRNLVEMQQKTKFAVLTNDTTTSIGIERYLI